MQMTETSRFAEHNRKKSVIGLDCQLFKSINNVIIMRACSSHPFGKTGLKVAKSFVFITSSLLAQCARIKSILLDQDWFQCLAVSFLAFVKTCPHPEVCPSAPEFGYQWIALVSSKLDNVVAVIFCRGLMSAPSHTFEIR